MEQQLILEYELQIDALIQRHKDETEMPSLRGTVAGIKERVEAVKAAMLSVDAEATGITNSTLKKDEGRTEGLKERLIAISRPKILEYVLSLAPRSWKRYASEISAG